MLINCFKSYPLSLLTALVVVALSLLPFGNVEVMKNVPLADKWTHMVMYGGLTSVIWFEYWRHHSHICWPRAIIGAIAAPILMGGVLELMQAYCTSYRSGEWLDWAANTIGVAIGTLLGCTLLRKIAKVKQ